MGRKTGIAVALVVLSLLVGISERAYAYAQYTVGPDHIFARNELEVNLANATLRGYSFTQNAAGSVKVYEHSYLNNVRAAFLHGDGDVVNQVANDPNCVSFRIPVPANVDPSNEEGQRLLDGVSFDLVYGNVGTYKGRRLQAEVHVSNLVDCTQSQRVNGLSSNFFPTPIPAIYGDGLGQGYVFSFKSYVAPYAQDYLVGWETEFFEGTEAQDVTVTFEYEDGTPVTLEEGGYVLSTISSLDMDGDPRGSEGTRITCAPLRGYVSENTTVVRGTMTNGLNGLGLLGTYRDADATPVYYGTVPTGTAEEDVNHGVTFVACGAGDVARVGFTVIDQMGAIGFPMSFAPITAFGPDRPNKSVDKQVAAKGDTLTYTVTQRLNDAKRDAAPFFRYAALHFEDELDPRLVYDSIQVLDGLGNDVSASAGQASSSGGKVSYDFSTDYLKGLELSGQTITFRLTAHVGDSAEGGDTIPNQAKVVFNNGYEVTSNPVETFVPEGPAKSESVSVASPGDELTYRISQELPDASVGVTSAYFSDVLDERLEFVSARMVDPSGADVTDEAGALLVDGQKVGYGFGAAYLAASKAGTYALEIVVRVRLGTESQTIPNQAGVTVAGLAEVRTNTVELKVSPPVVRGAKVTTYKSSDPASNSQVSIGDTISYELSSTNTGATTAEHSLIRDYVPLGTEYVEGSVSQGGVYVPGDSAGNASGRAYVEWEHEGIAVGEWVHDTFRVKVTGGGEAASREVGQIANHALTSMPDVWLKAGDPSNPEPNDLSNEVLHHLGEDTCDPVVQVVKTADPQPGSQVVAGQLIRYTLLVTNSGGSMATDVAVRDEVPEQTAYVYGSVSGENSGSYDAEGNAVWWNIPELAAGQSVMLEFTVLVGESSTAGVLVDNQASYAAGTKGMPAGDLANTSNVVEHVVGEVPAPEPEPVPPAEEPLPRTGRSLVVVGLIAAGAFTAVLGWKRFRRARGRSDEPKVY